MPVHDRRGRRWLLALLAALCAASATLWAIGGALAATRPAHTAKGKAAHHARPKKRSKPARAKHHKSGHRKPAHRPTKGKKPPAKKPPTSHPPAGSGAPAGPPPVGLSSGSYSNSAGTLSYQLYVPTSHATSLMPLVVALHGCTQTADSYRQLSGWDTYAQANGFVVLFPQQSSSRNAMSCWNWFSAPDMQRGSGEPAIIAGMVASTESKYAIDTHRVYVAGFSAGGAMANVMGATYPDLFAAVGSGSGCEYNGLPCVGYPGPDPKQTGQQAYQAMGSHARVMPAIVFQGSSDTTVDPRNASEIVSEWQVTDNYVLSGGPNGPIPTNPSKSTFGFTGSPFGGGGQSYTLTDYPDQNGNQLIQYCVVNGMNHAWSGGNSSQQYSDPSGPNETAMMYSFFMNHWLP